MFFFEIVAIMGPIEAIHVWSHRLVTALRSCSNGIQTSWSDWRTAPAPCCGRCWTAWFGAPTGDGGDRGERSVRVAGGRCWCDISLMLMTQKASFYWKPANKYVNKKNKPKKTTPQKKTNQKNKTKTIKIQQTTQRTINSARFETQRDFVLLPNLRSLLIPLALKVHSLLRCLLPSCDHDSQNPTRAA